MLKQRIQILYHGNVISKEVAEFVEYTIDVMKEQLPELCEEKSEMFTTHLAMAAQRICEGKIAEALDDGIWKEVTSSEQFQRANEFYEKIILKPVVDFPESEKQYLLLHICNILNENETKKE